METVETEELRKYCVYLITNLMNGKQYCGLTCNRKQRWKRHQKNAENGSQEHLYCSIRLYGLGNFRFLVVKESLTKKEAIKEETRLIKELNLRDPFRGYNLTDGGEGTQGISKQSLEKQFISRGWKKDSFCGRYFALELPTEEICKEYQNGSSTPALAEKYDCSEMAINTRLRASGIPFRSASDRMRWKFQRPRKGGKQYKPEISNEEIKSLYDSGMGSKPIGRKFGVSAQMIMGRLNKMGVTLRSVEETTRRLDIPDWLVIRLYKEGWSTKQIGEHFGMTAEGISYRLRTSGVERRPLGARNSTRNRRFEDKSERIAYIQSIRETETNGG